MTEDRNKEPGTEGEASGMSELLDGLEDAKARRNKRSPLGWMNQENRTYFGLRLYDQAKAIGVSSAELSAYETGRKNMQGWIVSRCHDFWREKFKYMVNFK